MKFRSVAKKLAYRRRGEESLKGNEQVQLKELKKLIVLGVVSEFPLASCRYCTVM